MTTTTTTTTTSIPEATTHRPLHDAIAGACAGAISKTTMAPIERTKLLMQLQSTSNETKSILHKKPSLQVAMHVYQTQGIQAFWRGVYVFPLLYHNHSFYYVFLFSNAGNLPNVMRQGGTSALNFMLMDVYKSMVRRMTHRTDTNYPFMRRKYWTSLLSGGMAGGTTTTILYPLEVLRTKLAMDMGRDGISRQYPEGMWNVAVSIARQDGIVRGFYKGYGVALVGVVLYRGLHLGGYDIFKSEYLKQTQTTTIPFFQKFCIAQVVSLVAGTFCYPLDSIRRRLMMQPDQRTWRLIRNVYKNEGVRGFYLGLGPNMIRSVGGALLLVAYDAIRSIL